MSVLEAEGISVRAQSLKKWQLSRYRPLRTSGTR